MYIRFNDAMTKSNYRNILSQAIVQAKSDYTISKGQVSLYKSIYNQLIDLNEKLIDENKVFTEAEAKERYPFGVIAIKNFEEDETYQDMLFFLSYGISRYPSMPEK